MLSSGTVAAEKQPEVFALSDVLCAYSWGNMVSMSIPNLSFICVTPVHTLI